MIMRVFVVYGILSLSLTVHPGNISVPSTPDNSS